MDMAKFNGVENIGREMYTWVQDLFPINRSITGEGVRETLGYLKKIIPEIEIYSVPSGTKVFDWEIPEEWSVREAWVKGPDGNKVIDFSDNNLHLVGYSHPVHKKINLNELQKHLYSLQEQPNAIPYVTSYYQPQWGFCLCENKRRSLTEGEYEVFIDSKLFQGSLNYGELVIPGSTDSEVFLSTYVCHPSMANNELSGPAVASALALYLKEKAVRHYTYRFAFVPETIGSIAYISRNINHLKSTMVAGFNLTCIGDERDFSFLPSRKGGTIADRAALASLRNIAGEKLCVYRWLDRGSDERQYCAPGIDLPVASIMRSKYGTYPEYHTSLDNLDLVTPRGLFGGFRAVKDAVDILERNFVPFCTVLGEPQLGKRGLYSNLSISGSATNSKVLRNILSLSDGDSDLLEISEELDQPFDKVYAAAKTLLDHGLLRQERIS